ncbi:hypothetical protein BLNAU_5422 [Blattamonas nauphoetae]|uniref:Uncharacterized protein n=1 Tax=Blattamonas nauphoetae TaxID=2049346 RepID=A0ABQ9Y7H8_9EUKA|nr:hypothetical protein BLNAU_5422 [Blattamonas nauphoetae]
MAVTSRFPTIPKIPGDGIGRSSHITPNVQKDFIDNSDSTNERQLNFCSAPSSEETRDLRGERAKGNNWVTDRDVKFRRVRDKIIVILFPICFYELLSLLSASPPLISSIVFEPEYWVFTEAEVMRQTLLKQISSLAPLNNINDPCSIWFTASLSGGHVGDGGSRVDTRQVLCPVECVDDKHDSAFFRLFGKNKQEEEDEDRELEPENVQDLPENPEVDTFDQDAMMLDPEALHQLNTSMVRERERAEKEEEPESSTQSSLNPLPTAKWVLLNFILSEEDNSLCPKATPTTSTLSIVKGAEKHLTSLRERECVQRELFEIYEQQNMKVTKEDLAEAIVRHPTFIPTCCTLSTSQLVSIHLRIAFAKLLVIVTDRDEHLRIQIPEMCMGQMTAIRNILALAVVNSQTVSALYIPCGSDAALCKCFFTLIRINDNFASV